MEVGDGLLCIRGYDGDAVRGRHEEPGAQDHVPVGITVACSAKLGHLCRKTVRRQLCAWLGNQEVRPWDSADAEMLP